MKNIYRKIHFRIILFICFIKKRYYVSRPESPIQEQQQDLIYIYFLN